MARIYIDNLDNNSIIIIIQNNKQYILIGYVSRSEMGIIRFFEDLMILTILFTTRGKQNANTIKGTGQGKFDMGMLPARTGSVQAAEFSYVILSPHPHD